MHLKPFAPLCLIPALLLTACQPATVDKSETSYATSSVAAPADSMDSFAVSSAPASVAASAEAPPVSCMAQLGPQDAKRLVERCVAVSPATHPPCHADNPCAMIRGEIERACAMYGPNEKKPDECTG
ncbi:MAG: hypothetical protein QM667_11620 [Asticcacaulis sp.]